MCRARLDSAAEAAELGALLMKIPVLKIPVRMPPATPPRPGDVRAREPFAAVEEHSPVHAFRQDECRTGSLFSMQLTLHALKELERETEEETAACFLARLSRRSCPEQPDSLPDTTHGIESGTDPERRAVTASEARWQEGMLCERTGTDWPMDYAASGSPGSLGRGPRSRVTAHRVLICPPGGMPRWIPADVRCRECAGKTLFGITCQPGTDPWPVSVSAYYQGQSALTIQAGWLRDHILQIDVSFAGSIQDLAWLHIAVEAGSMEDSSAADRRPENAGGDGQAGQAANDDDRSGCSLN